jgi:hypothetical protein
VKKRRSTRRAQRPLREPPNLFNSDAATAYTQTYTATQLADGRWVDDDPATAAVEVNNWGQITQLVSPRFMKLTIALDF